MEAVDGEEPLKASRSRYHADVLSAIWRLYHYWIGPILPFDKLARSAIAYPRFLASWIRYQRLAGEALQLKHGQPCLFDRADRTPYDPHYFYQAIWAMQRIKDCGTRQHVDIGSDVEFVGTLTTHVPVLFVDIRPLDARIKDLNCIAADILKLPFESNSVNSLSCLHVAEHVGLGRYGDLLNPLGTHQACVELARVLAPEGDMFFSVPVGSPRICFNAHRIHSPEQILDYFSGMHLIEFSSVDDNGILHFNHSLEQIKGAEYACGLFWFQKPG